MYFGSGTWRVAGFSAGVAWATRHQPIQLAGSAARPGPLRFPPGSASHDACAAGVWPLTWEGMVESAQIGMSGAYSETLDISYSCVQGWTGDLGGVGNTGQDPLLVDADGADNTPGTQDDNLQVSPGSPCIDAGDNFSLPTWLVSDLGGGFRRSDDADAPDTGSGACPVVDMGAYEVQTDCNNNGQGDGQEILGGASPDCNSNTVPDGCDLDNGTSVDVNGSGIPDECEDCNDNGILDGFDLAEGTSDDCNANNTPDECDIDGWPCRDCNENGVLDECEGDDCNGNGTLDECDIADGADTDCDVNYVPDLCDFANCDGDPGCGDCTSNGILDRCDIDNGTLNDANGDGFPDECELHTPASAGPPHHDAPKHRYISIVPNNVVSVAFRVELTSMQRCFGDPRRACIVDGDCPGVCDNDNNLQCENDGICGGGTCVPTSPCVQHSSVGAAKWVDEPFSNTCLPLYDCAGQWFSNLTDTAVYRVWTEDTLHITACEIVPVASYEVRSTADGVTFSDPLMIGTINKPQVQYGDCVGPVVGGAYTPPDGFTNVTDVQAYLIANQGGASAPHTTWVDVHGALVGSACTGGDCIVPQQILNVGDLQTIKFGFLGQTYVETPGQENPGDCPP